MNRNRNIFRRSKAGLMSNRFKGSIVIGRILAVSTLVVMSFGLNVHASPTGNAEAYSVFEQLNSHDIELASFAVTRGQAEPVRAVGHMILTDHVPLLNEMRDLAKKHGVKYTVDYQNERARKHKKAVLTLMDKAGDEFDQTYLTHELDFSKEFVSVIKNELIPNMQNGELKNYFTKTLYRFNEHLAHIEHATAMLSDPEATTQHDEGHSHGHKH